MGLKTDRKGETVMQVFYRAEKRSPRLPIVYRAEPAKPCCESMARWWGRLVGFGVRECPASTSREVSLFLDRPQANGKTVLEVVPVAYCPWCGEAVETCLVR
jgi:hypothetical protein